MEDNQGTWWPRRLNQSNTYTWSFKYWERDANNQGQSETNNNWGCLSCKLLNHNIIWTHMCTTCHMWELGQSLGSQWALRIILRIYDAMNWTASLWKSCVEAPNPNVMVFGDGAFGRWLGLDEVMGRGPHDEISVPVRRDTSKLPLSLPCGGLRRGGCLRTRKRALTGI